jgi:starvation-inducible outer membrane lipoprotein
MGSNHGGHIVQIRHWDGSTVVELQGTPVHSGSAWGYFGSIPAIFKLEDGRYIGGVLDVLSGFLEEVRYGQNANEVRPDCLR